MPWRSRQQVSEKRGVMIAVPVDKARRREPIEVVKEIGVARPLRLAVRSRVVMIAVPADKARAKYEQTTTKQM